MGSPSPANRLVSALARGALFSLVTTGSALWAAGRVEAATCNPATTMSTHALCFFDFSSYPGTGSQNFTFTLPDGSTLTATLTNTSGTSQTAIAAPVYGRGTFGGVAFADQDYVGIAGRPVFYSTANLGFTLSNVVLTDRGGRVVNPVTLVGVDAESTDQGDGAAGSVSWATTGTNLAVLELMPNPSGSFASVCTLSGVGTAAARCLENGNNAPAAAYILSSTVTSAQSFSLASSTVSREGFAFGLQLANLTVGKTVATREATSDQFTVRVSSGPVVAASATTSGTNNGSTASTGSQVVIPGDAYTLDEIGAATTSLANYVSTISCSNLSATSTTPLPAAGSVATSITITPAFDDQIACNFTNTALTLTDTAGAAQAVAPGSTVTDNFTLTNSSLVGGTFAIVQPTVVAADGTSLSPAGYAYNGTTYATLAALQAAINAGGATSAGTSITVGVKYVVPNLNGPTVRTTLAATLDSGTSASPQAAASETDTLPYASLTIVKSGTTTASVGGFIGYNVLVTNAGPSAADGASFTDPFPSGVAIVGTPTCASAGGATCGSVTVLAGTPPTVSSTIPTLPVNGSVTFTISATAGAAGTYANTASVSPPSGSGGGSKTSTLTTTVSQTSGLSKTVQNLSDPTNPAASTTDTAKPTDTLRYALSFTNTTGQAIANVTFTDVVPANTGFVRALCPAPATTLPTGITCATTVPAIGSTGTSVTFTYTGSLVNGATVTAVFDVKIF